jgi:hypothetical protein
MDEIWKDIPEYHGLYQVSDLGNIKSLDRIVIASSGVSRHYKSKKIKPYCNNNGYLQLALSKRNIITTKNIHKLVAIVFLNHIPCGFNKVVNHINHNKLDNRAVNLEVISHRKNTSQDHIKSTSKYVGVHWSKQKRRWKSRIYLNGKEISLGMHKDEISAHNAYQNELNKHKIL